DVKKKMIVFSLRLRRSVQTRVSRWVRSACSVFVAIRYRWPAPNGSCCRETATPPVANTEYRTSGASTRLMPVEPSQRRYTGSSFWLRKEHKRSARGTDVPMEEERTPH